MKKSYCHALIFILLKYSAVVMAQIDTSTFSLPTQVQHQDSLVGKAYEQGSIQYPSQYAFQLLNDVYKPQLKRNFAEESSVVFENHYLPDKIEMNTDLKKCYQLTYEEQLCKGIQTTLIVSYYLISLWKDYDESNDMRSWK